MGMSAVASVASRSNGMLQAADEGFNEHPIVRSHSPAWELFRGSDIRRSQESSDAMAWIWSVAAVTSSA